MRLNLARLAFEHLGHQILPDRPVRARELRHETLWVRVTAERDRRQTQASRPPFRAPVQRGRPGVGQTDPRCSKQLARLALGEPEIAGPQLSELVGKPKLVQPDRRIPARRQHHARRTRQHREQPLELRDGISGPQLVEIVDDQHERPGPLGQLRNNRVDQLVAGNPGRRPIRLTIGRGCRAADRIQNTGPEPLRLLFVAVDGHKRDASSIGRTISPRTQQRGLATSRRRRDDRHPPRHSAIQLPQKMLPVKQAVGYWNLRSDRPSRPSSRRAFAKPLMLNAQSDQA